MALRRVNVPAIDISSVNQAHTYRATVTIAPG